MKIQVIIRFLLLFFCLSMMVASAKANILKGIEMYNNRHLGAINNNASNQNINKAIKYFSTEMNKPEFEKEAALFLLKSYYYKGEFTTQKEQEKKMIFNKGKSLGEKYINKFPNSAEFRYWYLVNLGSWAKVYGIFTAAREGIADIMKAHSEKIIQIDPKYADGGGYFMLGAVHYKSPYIPFLLSWPNNNDAIKYLQLALETGSKKLNQKVYLAKALIKNNQQQKAKKLLLEVISANPDSFYLVEELDEIIDAHKLLDNF